MGQNIGTPFEKTLDNHAKNIGNPLENHGKNKGNLMENHGTKHRKPMGKPLANH